MIGRSDLGDALRFLTRVPMPRGEARSFGAATFPLVGLLLGATAFGADFVLRSAPAGVRAVTVVALWALATGALHYDGLADVLDALGADSREERLLVMRDAALGTYAALGLVLVVLFEVAALAALAGRARTQALLIAPMLGRLAMLFAAFEAPRARDDGLGAEFVRRLTAREVIVGTVIAGVVAASLAGASGLAAIVVAAAIAAAVRLRAKAAFGGVTGDVLGACGKLVEAALLVLWTIP